MISGKRKTIGVFLCKAYALFDDAVCLALEQEAKKLDLDVIIFTTVGYFASQNEYDAQERGMFAFAPIEQLDGIIVAPDTYEIEGFREQLNEELISRAKCPVIHFAARSMFGIRERCMVRVSGLSSRRIIDGRIVTLPSTPSRHPFAMTRPRSAPMV